MKAKLLQSFSQIEVRDHLLHHILKNKIDGIELKTWKIINFEWVIGNNLNKNFILLKNDVLNFILFKNNTHNKWI